MIIKGGSRSNGGWFAAHLMNGEDNERVEVKEMRGVCSDTLRDALREMEGVAAGTRVENYFYHANINPKDHEHLTPEQWTRAVDTLERNLGLTGQPRLVVEHEKEGRTHQHIIWSRVDLETMKAIPDSHDYQKHQATARELEIDLGLERGQSVLTPAAERDSPRPARTPENWAMMRGKETGIDPRDIKAELSELWQQTDSGKAFTAALEERGYSLAQGNRRDFCVIDHAGTVHSLARRLDGVKAADVRERMEDIDRTALPSVDDARTAQRERFTDPAEAWANRTPTPSMERTEQAEEHEDSAGRRIRPPHWTVAGGMPAQQAFATKKTEAYKEARKEAREAARDNATFEQNRPLEADIGARPPEKGAAEPAPAPAIDVWARAPNREVTDQQREKASKEKQPNIFATEITAEDHERFLAKRGNDRDHDQGWERER